MDFKEIYFRIQALSARIKVLKKLWIMCAKQEGLDVREVLVKTCKNMDSKYQTVATQVDCLPLIKSSKQCTCEHEQLLIDSFTQTDIDDFEQTWNPGNIREEVVAAAEDAMKQTGFVFDQSSGTYYDQQNGCHYLPDMKLFYYHQSKCFYYYDEGNEKLTFYARAAVANNEATNYADIEKTENPDIANEDINIGIEAVNLGNEDASSDMTNDPSTTMCQEDNNWNHKKVRRSSSPDSSTVINSSVLANVDLVPSNVIIEAGPKPFVPDLKNHIASCIRIIVQSSEESAVNIGTLFVVTCNGGTLGREGSHEVVIPDNNVSKIHASFLYECKQDGCDSFKIVDMGSRNGTFIDGIRLSESLSISKPFDLVHGSIIKVGSTILLCHIHDKTQTCDDCEPSYTLRKEGLISITKYDKSLSHKEEVKRLRKKFGLGNTQYINASLPLGYSDRSKQRRNTTGSSHPSQKTECTSSMEPVSKINKGYQLLSKMGWEDGESLGKSNSGIKFPIMPYPVIDKRSGLGSSQAQKSTLSHDEFRKALIWKKARQRFKKDDHTSIHNSNGNSSKQ